MVTVPHHSMPLLSDIGEVDRNYRMFSSNLLTDDIQVVKTVISHKPLILGIIFCLVLLEIGWVLLYMFYSPQNDPSRSPSANGIPLSDLFFSHLHANQSSTFSTHHCIGPHPLYSNNGGDYIHRQCVLHNVCLNRQPLLLVEPSIPDVTYVIDYFRPEKAGWVDPFQPFETTKPPLLVALRNGGHADTSEKLRSLAVNVRPADNNKEKLFIPGAHVMYQLLATSDMNFGHFLLDDVYPVWESIRSFDTRNMHPDSVYYEGFTANHLSRYSRENVQVLSTRNCNNYSSPMNVMCAKFRDGLFPVVSSKPVLDVESAFSHYDMLEKEELCFETLLAGTGRAGAVGWDPQNRNRAAGFSTFRNEMYFAHGLDPFYRPSYHHIILVNKHGKRAFANLLDMYQLLLTTPRYSQMDIKVIEDFKEARVVEQLQLLSNTTIVVTPCGGISMVFFLLPSPATIIVPDFPHIDGNAAVYSLPMEGLTWDWQTNVDVLRYKMLDNTDYIPPNPANPTENLRDAAVVLKAERLLPMIDEAIFRASIPS